VTGAAWTAPARARPAASREALTSFFTAHSLLFEKVID
jgi:hypothetical protein